MSTPRLHKSSPTGQTFGVCCLGKRSGRLTLLLHVAMISAVLLFATPGVGAELSDSSFPSEEEESSSLIDSEAPRDAAKAGDSVINSKAPTSRLATGLATGAQTQGSFGITSPTASPTSAYTGLQMTSVRQSPIPPPPAPIGPSPPVSFRNTAKSTRVGNGTQSRLNSIREKAARDQKSKKHFMVLAAACLAGIVTFGVGGLAVYFIGSSKARDETVGRTARQKFLPPPDLQAEKDTAEESDRKWCLYTLAEAEKQKLKKAGKPVPAKPAAPSEEQVEELNSVVTYVTSGPLRYVYRVHGVTPADVVKAFELTQDRALASEMLLVNSLVPLGLEKLKQYMITDDILEQRKSEKTQNPEEEEQDIEQRGRLRPLYVSSEKADTLAFVKPFTDLVASVKDASKGKNKENAQRLTKIGMWAILHAHKQMDPALVNTLSKTTWEKFSKEKDFALFKNLDVSMKHLKLIPQSDEESVSMKTVADKMAQKM
eukprot:GHVT01081786.1.p1 GENE.GHVT01081786.1~~GHVT01081786.1.p1  ORF type:complete len:485 (+),score=87.31 GHVT01081786.1:338-1792(+)